MIKLVCNGFLRQAHFFIRSQGYCWLENVRGHFAENAPLESLSPILCYKIGPLFQNEGAILKIKGQFCPWPLPKLSLRRLFDTVVKPLTLYIGGH